MNGNNEQTQRLSIFSFTCQCVDIIITRKLSVVQNKATCTSTSTTVGHYSSTTLFVEVISDFQVSLLISANSMVSFLIPYIFYIKDITLNSSYEVLIDQIKIRRNFDLRVLLGKCAVLHSQQCVLFCSVLCVCVCVCLVFPYNMRVSLVYVWCMCSRDQHSWWVQLTGNRILIAALQPQSIIMKTTNFVKYNVFVLFRCH